MNSPDVHLTDAPGPAAEAESESESDEIHLLRIQIGDLSEKAKKLHARWLVAIAIAFIGLVAPLGILAGYEAVSGWHLMQQRDAIKKEYLSTLNAIQVSGQILAPAEDDVAQAKALREAASKLEPGSGQKVLEALNAAAVARAAKQKKAEDQDGQFETVMFVGTALGVFCAPWLCPIIYVTWVSLTKRMIERAKFRLEYKIIEAKARQLQDKIGEDFFTRLVQINFKYLDQYYFQTHQQANKSFALSVAASIVGLVIVVAAIAMVLLGHKDPASLTAVLGGLSQFIAAVFFYLYNRTVLKMGEYHKKLVLTQNIGIALKITDLLPPEDKAQTQRALVGQLTFNINQFLSEIETGVAAPVAA